MFIRFALSIVLGSIVTVFLLFVMQFMITLDGRGELRRERHEIVDFVRVERPAHAVEPERKPERPPESQVPPALPAPDFETHYDYGITIAVADPMIQADVSVAGSNLAASDGEYLPIVKVAPNYPQRALARRLEGFVLVEFIVTASGTVRDVVVLESTADIFEDAAIEAALKFKFKPRVVDGEPIEVRGVKNRIVFELAV